MDYLQKYLKYKNKYLTLKKMKGGIDNNKLLSDLFIDYDEIFSNNYPEKSNINIQINNNEKLKKIIFSENIILKNSKTLYNVLEKNNKIDNNILKKQNVNTDNNILEENKPLYGNGKNRISWDWIVNSIIYPNIDNSNLNDNDVNAVNDVNDVNDVNSASIHISSKSDIFDLDDIDAKYAGIICWHNAGRPESINIGTEGNVLPIYVLIQNTKKWSGLSFFKQGCGTVHSNLYTIIMGVNVDKNNATICSSGFSIMFDNRNREWRIKYSSMWLNEYNYEHLNFCENIKNKSMGMGEIYVTNLAISAWTKRYNGCIIPYSAIITSYDEMDKDSWSRLREVIDLNYLIIAG